MSISATVGKVARVAQQGLSLISRGHVAQAAALCYRNTGGERRFLVISSRKSGKLGVPKGNVDPGETSPIAAAREAFEEAGVRGTAQNKILTAYTYRKDGKRLRRHVAVHPLEVAGMTEDFPERGERTLAWLPAAEAARQVAEPALKSLFEALADGSLPEFSPVPHRHN
jgi:8-oxo-dGTP pyrophosphatase MutT (NUDIX family)